MAHTKSENYKSKQVNIQQDINLPAQDIKMEPGQPTFKKALQAVLVKPRKKPHSPSQDK